MQKNTKETLADETDQLVRQVLEQGVDGVIGGFPCQDISIAAQGWTDAPGASGERSGLFGSAIDTFRLVGAKFLLLENVADLYKRYRSRDMGRILGSLAAIGCNIEWDCVGAGTVGAPHHRARAYILAHYGSDRRARYFPKKIQWQPEFSLFKGIRTLEEYRKLPTVPAPELCRTYPGLTKRLHGIGNGNPPCIIRELTKGLKV